MPRGIIDLTPLPAVPHCPSHHEAPDDDNVVEVDRWDIDKQYYIKYSEDWEWVDWNAAVSCQQHGPNTAYHCYGTHADLLPHAQPLCKPHHWTQRKMTPPGSGKP
jgi:hypothetical protein